MKAAGPTRTAAAMKTAKLEVGSGFVLQRLPEAKSSGAESVPALATEQRTFPVRYGVYFATWKWTCH